MGPRPSTARDLPIMRVLHDGSVSIIHHPHDDEDGEDDDHDGDQDGDLPGDVDTEVPYHDTICKQQCKKI